MRVEKNEWLLLPPPLSLILGIVQSLNYIKFLPLGLKACHCLLSKLYSTGNNVSQMCESMRFLAACNFYIYISYLIFMFGPSGDLGSLLSSLLIHITDLLRSKIILKLRRVSKRFKVQKRTQNGS